jgi:hypothetical protein
MNIYLVIFASISSDCIFCFEAEAGTEVGTTASPSEVTSMCSNYELLNYIDIKAKCRHLKKLTCKRTLGQVFIIVYM